MVQVSQNEKKKRIFLGYSAENLRSIANPSSEGKQDNSNGAPVVGRDTNEDPGSLKNLDEVNAPELIDPTEARAEGYLEDREPGAVQKSDGPHAQGDQWSRTATEVYSISYLVFFSILGALARVGLQALTFYPGAPVQTGVLWANIGGSFVMGYLVEDRALFREEWGGSKLKHPSDQKIENGPTLERRHSGGQRHGAVKKTLPLYIGLTTGFCGSFTSFSSFIRDTFYALANALPVPINHPSAAPISQTVNVPRNPGYSFLAILAVVIITIGLSLGALQVGGHLALGLEPVMPSIPFLPTRKVLDRFMVVLAAGCWLAGILMAIFPPDRPGGPVGNPSWTQETWRSQALFAVVFAPPGCLLRFYASTHLNGRIKGFPLGTFMVNMFGTAMEAMFIDLQRAPVGGMVGCQVLQGLEDGFCGCLTTVSTWVLELKSLKIRHAYIYGGVSVAVGLSLMVVIVGSLLWTQGFAPLLCVT